MGGASTRGAGPSATSGSTDASSAAGGAPRLLRGVLVHRSRAGSEHSASPSRAPAHPKKTRGVAVQAALAAAAPPITATNYAAAALAAAANPHPPSA